MKLSICRYGEEVLGEKAVPVEEITPEIKELIESMVETMYESEGVGLAAPQVGESIRLVCIDQTGPDVRGDLMVLVNPEIAECDGTQDSEEGCLSCPDFTGKLKRHDQVTVNALDGDGNPVCVEAEGYLSIILQHEIDHLDGVTIVDRASPLKRSMYKKKVNKWQKIEQEQTED